MLDAVNLPKTHKQYQRGKILDAVKLPKYINNTCIREVKC